MSGARLVLEGSGRSCPLTRSPVVVGRLQSCGITLEGEAQSSRKHYEVVPAGTRWVVRDLGSRNGTALNGTRLTREVALRDGDAITVGASVVRYEAPRLTLAPGGRLGGCPLGEPLGRGEYGAQFAARQGSLDREVVVEAVDPDLAGDPEVRSRYERRARVAGALDHPRLRAVFDRGEDQGTLYTVFEACAGEPLARRLERVALDVPTSLGVLEGVARALAHVHGRGERHGALHPGCVWVASGPEGVSVKLAGLGESEGRLDPYRQDAALQAAYASPEEAAGRAGGPEADLYALGLIAYRLLAGREPYTGKPAAVLRAHAAPDPIAPPAAAEPALAALLTSLLAKEPGARPTAGDAAERLAALRGAGGAAKPAAARARSSSSGRQRRGSSSGRQRRGSSSGRLAAGGAPERAGALARRASSGSFSVGPPEPAGTLVLRLALLGAGYLLIALAASLGARVTLRLLTG